MEQRHGITKEKWIAVLADAGLDEQARSRWHAAFERREPAGHQALLEWLGIAAPEIERIRRDSRA